MTEIIIQFIEANSTKEIDQIIFDNLDLMNKNPRLFSFARKARKRVMRINREKRKSWRLCEMN